jgi:hypothetical protein
MHGIWPTVVTLNLRPSVDVGSMVTIRAKYSTVIKVRFVFIERTTKSDMYLH